MDPEEDDLPLDDNLGEAEPPEPDEDDLPLDEDEDEGPLDSEPEPASPPAAQPSRGERRFQAMSERVRAAEERAAAAERRAEERERSASQESFRRQEEERLANMSEGERIEYRVNQRLNHIQFQSWDSNDRVAFNSLAERNPAVGNLKTEVEQVYQERLAAGQPVDRTTIAKFLIGEKALAKAPRAKAAGQRAEQQGRERQRVRAPSSGGDIPASGRRQADERTARFNRLKDVEI